MHRPRYDPFTQPVQHLHDLYALGKALVKASPGSGRKLLATELSSKHKCSVSHVLKAAQFARAYDANEFDDLIALRRPDTDALGTGHLFVLMRISDRARRSELQKRVAHEGWSVRKLKQFLDGDGSKKYATNTKLGRKRKVPTTAKEAIANLLQRSEAWLTAANDLNDLFSKNQKHLQSSRLPAGTSATLGHAIAAVNAWKVSGELCRKRLA